MKKISKKIISLILAFAVLIQSLMPSRVYALTSGPKSPDFSNFTPASTTDMVDLATGDFNYNLPLLEVPGSNGSGYPLSLSYNSNVNSEQESSWVGFGWTLNAGIIDRNLRGYPDDYSGQDVDFYNKNRPNWSLSKTLSVGVEAQSFDGSISSIVRFNNYNGYYFAKSLSASAFGLGARVTADDNGTTFSPEINLFKLFASFKNKEKEATEKEKDKNEAQNKAKDDNSKGTERKVKVSFDYQKLISSAVNNVNSSLLNNTYGLYSFCQSTSSVNVDSRKGWAANFSANIQVNPAPTNMGPFFGMNGGFNVTSTMPYDKKKAYGYFNTSECYSPNDMMDYYMEKETPFSKRDVFIGMPFSNFDIFTVSGEGVAGGFRSYPEYIQNYRPAAYNSEIDIHNIGTEVGAGAYFSGGLDIGVGSQKTEYGVWGIPYPKAGKNFYRFNNDLGGEIEYSSDGSKPTTGIVHAQLESVGGIGGLSPAILLEDNVSHLRMVQPKNSDPTSSNKSKSSSHIEPLYLSKNKIVDNLNEKNIVGYRITNTNGDVYEYGFPVYVKNETQLSFNIAHDGKSAIVKNNYLAYRATPLKKVDGQYKVTSQDLKQSSNKTVVGQIKSVPYATSYLLTQIREPNYVDVNNNGEVDDADFGGWTKFTYRKIFGYNSEHGKWYRFRSPYNGLYYSRNSISDLKDDLGSVITGEKEVANLHTIETDSHIAFFVTNKYRHNKSLPYNVPDGSQAHRLDCKAAAELNADGDPHSVYGNSEMEEDAPEYLEKIVLFSKSDPTTPIKVVCFKYSNNLVPGLPNCKDNRGKLTLEKVWFEYGNVKPIKVSPYEFCYEYKKSTQISNPEFKRFFVEYDNLEGLQNPPYTPEQLDTWGSIQLYGEERKNFQIPWRYQGKRSSYGKDLKESWRAKVDSEVFDPAAWHLKSIKLPTGGEIIIQYEEKDYKYVQDKPVMAMASLLNASNSSKIASYDVNVDDLGCDPFKKEEVEKLKGLVDDYFQKNTEDAKDNTNDDLKVCSKVYFKFLFGLLSGQPNLDSDHSEYITGYAAYKGASLVERGDGSYTIRILLGSEPSKNGERTVTPRQGALDFYNNNRKGLCSDNMITPNYAKLYDDDIESTLDNDNSFAIKAMAMFSHYSFNSPITEQDAKIAAPSCNSIEPSLSFLKLPMLSSKKGGGVRVKRLMIYDQGLGMGKESLYGSEYHYVLEDGITTSGVATNEPSNSREENPLIQYVVRKGQSLFSRLTVGEDKEQTEGPIGESILPGPSVTYSRVVTENIYSSDRSIKPNGFTINEFYTTYDYPFNDLYASAPGSEGGLDEEGGGVELSEVQSNHEKLPEIPIPIMSFGYETLSMEQGFRFIQNSMNGKPKGIAIYGGRYGVKDFLTSTDKPDDTYYGYLVSRKTYEYYEPGEKVKTLFPVGNTGEFVPKYTLPGKEEEIVVEKKSIGDYTNDINVEFDIGVSYPISIQFSLMPSLKINTSIVETHATTRILKYPAILKSESDYKDGVTQKVEYVAFNASTGQPIIIKSSDIYADDQNANSTKNKAKAIYSFSLPAHWIYPEMGRKEVDASGTIANSNQLSDVAFNLVTYNQMPQSSWFRSGGIPNVISAGVTTYTKGWGDCWNDPAIVSDYEFEKRCASKSSAQMDTTAGVGSFLEEPKMSKEQLEQIQDKLSHIWRAKSTYSYNIQDVTSKGDASFDQGYYPINTMFDWADGVLNSNWLKISEIKKYSPQGLPLEEVDYMGIASSIRYNKMGLPSIIAHNAKYSELYFDDFEFSDKAYKGDAHSGKGCLKLKNNDSVIENIILTKHLVNKGATLKLWAKSQDKSLAFTFNSNRIILNKVASCGEWSLYSTDLDITVLGKDPSITIRYEGSSILLVDDVLFRPKDSQSTCYVYSNAKKLLNQFDDQHFSLVYVYNQEGMLTHKKVETEKGVKTIQETMYNIPKKERLQ